MTTISKRIRDITDSDVAAAIRVPATGTAASTARIDAGLAVLRVVVGAVFAAHGAQKLFALGLPGLIEGFAGAGVPLPTVTAPAVAFVELLGGLALIAGLFTRGASAALAVVMLGAMLIVHLPAGFFLPDGVEFVLTLLAATVMLTLAGAGAWSLDAVRARRRPTA